MKARFLVLILLVFVIPSCTITKRYHSLGFHVEWKHQLTKKSKSELSLNKTGIAPIAELSVKSRSKKFVADSSKCESMISVDSKNSIKDQETVIQKSAIPRNRRGFNTAKKVFPLFQTIDQIISKPQNHDKPKSKYFTIGIVGLSIFIGGLLCIFSIFWFYITMPELLIQVGALLIITGLLLLIYALKKIIAEKRKGKKQHKVGIVAMCFLAIGLFLISYAFLGSLDVWAGLGYLVLGFISICIFLLIAITKAIRRRIKRNG